MPRRKSRSVQKPATAPSRISFSWTLALGVGLFILTRLYILFVLQTQISDLRGAYLRSVTQVYDEGRVPYQGNFSFVYPPVAWWMIYAPRFLQPAHIQGLTDPVQIDQIRAVYCGGFRGEMFLCDLVSFVLLLVIVAKRRRSLVGWAAITYAFITGVFGHMLYDRLDIGLTFLLLAWAFCWIKSQEHLDGVGWSTAAYTLLGLGVSYKLVPIIVVPLVLLGDWKTPRQTMRLVMGMLAFLAAAGLPFLIQYQISGAAVFSFMQFHSERGIQVESLYSTLMSIGTLLGWDAFIIFSHGAYNIGGDLSKLMITLSSVVLLLFLGLNWFWLLFRSVESRRLESFRVACYVLFATVILSRVLSPQYFLWAFPMSLLFAVETFPQKSLAPWVLAGLWLMLAVLATWLFPYHYLIGTGVVALVSENPLQAKVFNPLPWIVLGLRNFLYLGMAIWLGFTLYRRRDEKVPA
jgi:hypothetical protein